MSAVNYAIEKIGGQTVLSTMPINPSWVVVAHQAEPGPGDNRLDTEKFQRHIMAL